MYNLPPEYVSRLEPAYFNDTLTDSAYWQCDVYRLAATLARQVGAKRLIDLGCGRGEKLLSYGDEFKLTGIDYGSNFQAVAQNYPQYEWVEIDLNTQVIQPQGFTNNVVICADVIEHLPDPLPLIETLRNACKTADYVLVSTPDRERMYGGAHSGPPANSCHVREWTESEFTAWLKAEGFPVVWSGWTVSFDKQRHNLNTILTVLSKHNPSVHMPDGFQASPRLWQTKNISKSKVSNGVNTKVWMTPTPNEAARDTTNAIHQIVMRLDKHLPDYGFELVEHPDNAQLYAAHAGQGSSAPVHVAHYHGLYNTANLHNSGGFYGINAHVIKNLRTAKLITAPSEWIADIIRRDMHINPEIIGWGVDTDEWTPVSDPGLYVLWNKARVDAVSDPAPMLELAARVPNMPFLTTFGVGGANVKTIGRQPYEVMKNYVRNASIYLATVTETFGIATVEAMAAGVPILGFRHGNTAYLVEHGVTGFLAEPDDIDGLYEGLIYCMKYRAQLGANAREAAKRYTWARVAEQIAGVYQRAMLPHTGAKVSVVIPCHNYERYIGEAIESALAQQTRATFEIIVVLDRCTDNSAAIVGRYIDRGVQALVVDNGSLSATRNDGIQMAKGEYIVCLDADDKLGSSLFIQTLADELDNDRTLGIAFTSIRIMDADGNLGHLNAWPKGFDFEAQAQRRNQIPSCCMFRKQAWERAGGFRPWFKYAEDAEFWTTVLSIGYGAKHVVEDGWFHYRIHNNSASQVHRTGEVKEPDWLEFHPWAKDGQRPFAAGGKPPLGSWPVRFYLKPDVSIILPVGEGHEQLVKDALHSVEGQTHRYWECIVVNDTGKPLDLTGFPWARQYFSSNEGAGFARNLGAHFANAPFLAFLDADDILKPRFLEATLAAYRQHGRYVYTDWMTDDRRGHTEVHVMPNYSLDALWKNPSLHAVTALIPRKWFIDAGGFDESLKAFEDVDFFMKLRTHGYCGVRVPEPLLIYNQDTGKRRIASKKQEVAFRDLLKQRYADYMEGIKPMCDCVDPPKGKAPVPPTIENAPDYRETYGEPVKVKLTSQFAGESPTTFRGPATRVHYGQRARGDEFWIWEADLVNSDGVFTRLELFIPEPVTTAAPPSEPTVVEFAPPKNIQLQAEISYNTGMVIPTIEHISAQPTSEPSLETRLDGMSKKQMAQFAAEWGVELTRAQLKNRETMIEAILTALKELQADEE